MNYENRAARRIEIVLMTVQALTSVVVATSIMALAAMGQDPLTANQQQAIDQINQRDVLATLSFLAADEMRGRDTPSIELNIASAYVAARFRGAGLTGGADGSFFQNHEIATQAMPTAARLVVRSGGKPVQVYGAVSAGSDRYQYSGPVTRVDSEADSDDQQMTDVIVVSGAGVETGRDQFMFLRQTRAYQQRGVRCVLVEVDEKSSWITAAERAQRPQLINPRRGRLVPIVIVSKIDDSQPIEVSVPEIQNGQATVRNVIGVLPGSDPERSKEALIFSAHLDHIGTQPGRPDPVFNGADDDASGVTGVLELADAFAAMNPRPKRTLIFMTFWGEERGLLGSRYFAQHPTWPLENIVANINLEMIGRPEPGGQNKVWMTGWDQSDLGPIMAPAASRVGVELFEHPRFSAMLYRASDNFSFATKGIVAHSFSAGSLHKDYHQPSDEWEKIELGHMTRVIQGLMAGVLPIAEGEATPKPAARRRNR